MSTTLLQRSDVQDAQSSSGVSSSPNRYADTSMMARALPPWSACATTECANRPPFCFIRQRPTLTYTSFLYDIPLLAKMCYTIEITGESR